MSVLHLIAAPLAEQLAAAPAGITSGRLGSLVAGAVGLVGVVAGGLALSGRGRTTAVTALVAGLLGAALAVLHLATSTGGFGTGSGRAGAIVALVVGLVGVALGGLATARARRVH
ncbi:DUF6223 family protein [Pseudonocardia zijingensis]|jgi:hypothetical protein|uniref:Uncharacterized protein n=1 Tax=Pseudonocardia zijingensis TaxID=153376 RepID=A0ABN1N6W9_9PSEU